MFKKDKKNNVENFIKKDEKVEMSKKDIFYLNLKDINFNLDLVRNGIFNIIVTNNYVTNIEFEFKEDMENIKKNIVNINNIANELIKKLNIKFDKEKKN